jgi:hypothetical protein
VHALVVVQPLGVQWHLALEKLKYGQFNIFILSLTSFFQQYDQNGEKHLECSDADVANKPFAHRVEIRFGDPHQKRRSI